MSVNPRRFHVTELDFDDIKTNLKTFLNNQTEFTDYDFEGSGMNILMDVLAYNTHYLAYNVNMAMNEAFLDSALLRSSVVSHAKTLGYTPKSATAPVAYVNITLNDNTLTSATLNKGKIFKTETTACGIGIKPLPSLNVAVTEPSLTSVAFVSSLLLYLSTSA